MGRDETALQRVGPLSELVPLLQERGVSFEQIFDGASITAVDLRPDATIPFAAALELLDRAARVTGMADLGIQIGARNDHKCLGLVGQLMSCAPTLGDALGDYISVQGGISRGASAYLLRLGDDFAFGYGIYHRHAAGADQAYGLAMAAGVNIVRSLTKGRVDPVSVLLSQRAPANAGSFTRVLKCEVCFNQPLSCIVLRDNCLATPLPGADPARRAELLAKLHEYLLLDRLPVAARLRHALRPLLSGEDASLERSATRLAMSARTLDRQLLAENTTFAAERDAVRYTMARELLALTDLPAGDVAAALSYATPSAFVRAFKRWSGITPAAWRLASSNPPKC